MKLYIDGMPTFKGGQEAGEVRLQYDIGLMKCIHTNNITSAILNKVWPTVNDPRLNYKKQLIF